MLLCELDRASERQKLYVFELNIPRRFVFALAWIEFRDNAVEDVSVIVDQENIFDANVLIVQ